MGFGIGILLLVPGLILVTGAVDLPASVDDVVDTGVLGWILVVVGVLALGLALVSTQQQRNRTTYVEERRTDGL